VKKHGDATWLEWAELWLLVASTSSFDFDLRWVRGALKSTLEIPSVEV
jgi:hypothetical protein